MGRIFMTGVSPMTLDDLTSGFNITSNVSLDEDLNALCGFTSEEVERIVTGVMADGGYTLDPDSVVADLRLFYNGYLFSRRAPPRERVFNPDMVLYFAKGWRRPRGTRRRSSMPTCARITAGSGGCRSPPRGRRAGT